MTTNTTAPAEPARTDASIDLETALNELRNMADVSASLLEDAISGSRKARTDDMYFLHSRLRERLLFSAYKTETMARELVEAFNRGEVRL